MEPNTGRAVEAPSLEPNTGRAVVPKVGREVLAPSLPNVGRDVLELSLEPKAGREVAAPSLEPKAGREVAAPSLEPKVGREVLPPSLEPKTGRLEAADDATLNGDFRGGRELPDVAGTELAPNAGSEGDDAVIGADVPNDGAFDIDVAMGVAEETGAGTLAPKTGAELDDAPKEGKDEAALKLVV